jgi:hypothetical protein
MNILLYSMFIALFGAFGVYIYILINVYIFPTTNILESRYHIFAIVMFWYILIIITRDYMPHIITLINYFTWFSFIIYIFLYSWLNVRKSMPSFLAFFGNILILCLYILGFINLIKGLPNPIYLENLSTFSYYRYMLFLIIALIGICTYLLFKLGVIPNSWESKLSIFTFPYFKEEIRKLLASRDISGSYCIRLTNMLIHSLTFRYIFFTLHFLVFHFFRLVYLYLFIHFVFFHADLRVLIQLLPISFLIWLLRFLEYYFFYFLQLLLILLRKFYWLNL